MKDLILKDNLTPLDNRINFQIIKEYLEWPWWDDLRFPAFSAAFSTATGRLAWGYNNMGVNFKYNALYREDEQVSFIAQMPHKKKFGSPVHPHIHWAQRRDYIPNMLLEYRFYNNGKDAGDGSLSETWTKSIITDGAFPYQDEAYLGQISEFPPIDPPENENVSAILEMKLYRDTANASGLFAGACPYNTGGNMSVLLKELDLHYQVDQPGSTEEYVK